MEGRIFSINISDRKGGPKDMVRQAAAVQDLGLEGDAHAGPGLRQVSLLAIEDIEDAEFSSSGSTELRPGIFGENITTEGVDLSRLAPDDRILIGDAVVLRVRRRGKDCPDPCRIGRELGVCIMPKLGLFASVEQGGPLRVYDKVRIRSNRPRYLRLPSLFSLWKT
jgi:cyclic pyranopterin phosphate synthase